MRRLRDFTRAGSFGLELPAELRSSLLREGAGLSEQNQQNLTTLLRGRELDVDYLALLLSRMDARTERITGFVTHEEEANSPEIFLAEPGQGEEEPSEDESEADFEDSDVIALEELNFTEDQANYVYAGVGGGLPGARDQRPRGSKGQGRGKLTRDQMKKISRCRLCNKKGHWAEACHLSRPQSSATVTTQRPTGFCYLGPSASSGSGAGWVLMAGRRR